VSVISALLALAALVMLIGPKPAQATEVHYCWGANLGGYGAACSNGYPRPISTLYGSSAQQPVCIFKSATEGVGCSHVANEGVWLGQNPANSSEAVIMDFGGGPAKVYGVMWY
jgi:hypothetical protein